jgi:hypothetical protein
MNVLIKSLLETAMFPFSRKKKSAEKTEETSNDASLEEKEEDESHKEPPPKDEIFVNASGLELVLRGHEYKIRLTKPAQGAREHELQDALKRNRALLEKSKEDLYRFHCGNIEQNKQYNQNIENIEKGMVKPENDKMKAAFAEMLENGKVDLDTWKENIIRPGMQNALVARANIDLLIPLINIRGGEAEYKGLEALPIADHINKIRDDAANMAAEDLIPPPEPPETDEWTIQEFFTAAIVVIIIVVLLRAFI